MTTETVVFDETRHRQNAISAYSAIRWKYEAYGIALESLLKAVLKSIPTHQISSRAKEIESFAKKACALHDSDSSRPKYLEPCTEIEDMCAARIIVYTLSDLERVKEAIAKQFNLSSEGWDDKGARLVERQTVGYRSLHAVVQLNSTRNFLPEYVDFEGLKAEIQVRTVLQHAWAEIEHDIRYKSDLEPHKELFQRFAALAGLIEIGDREFEEIVKINNLRRKKVRELAQLEDSPGAALDHTELNETKTKSDESQPLILSLANSNPENDQPSVSPRILIGARRYLDAITAYSELIEEQPLQVAHRVGRAKARFLNGDARGALDDLEQAEGIKIGFPGIARLRSLITGVDEPHAASSYPNSVNLFEESTDTTNSTVDSQFKKQIGYRLSNPSNGDNFSAGSFNYSGHMHIANGEPDLALLDYEAAERDGFSPVFTTFNRAIVFVLKENYVFAMHVLGRLKPFPATILELHHSVLASVCLVLSGQRDAADLLPKIVKIKQDLEHEISYSYEKSVMLFVNRGLKRLLPPDAYSKIESFFLVLGAKEQ